MELNFVVRIVRPHIYDFQSVTAVEDATAELICRSRGDPVPQLQFSKFGDSALLKLGRNVSQLCCHCCFVGQFCLLFRLHWLLAQTEKEGKEKIVVICSLICDLLITSHND